MLLCFCIIENQSFLLEKICSALKGGWQQQQVNSLIKGCKLKLNKEFHLSLCSDVLILCWQVAMTVPINKYYLGNLKPVYFLYVTCITRYLIIQHRIKLVWKLPPELHSRSNSMQNHSSYSKWIIIYFNLTKITLE